MKAHPCILQSRESYRLFFTLGLALHFHLVGRLNRRKYCRMVIPLKQFNVWHDTMAADNSGEVLNRRKEFYALIERDDFVVVLSRLIAISLHLLGPGDHQAEVSRFGELCQFGCLGR